MEFDPAVVPVEPAERQERKRAPDCSQCRTRSGAVGARGGGLVSGAWHAVLIVGIGAGAGAALVNLLCLLRMVLDAIAVGEVEQPYVRPDPRSVTVWTGVDWSPCLVIPVAFRQRGVAVAATRRGHGPSVSRSSVAKEMCRPAAVEARAQKPPV
jgi:hypothetical protein